MISYLRGRIIAREGHRAIVDVSGVGYDVQAPLRAIEAWSHSDETVEVHVSTQVREDAISLFGFSTAEERRTFERMIAVNGIGPKLALACIDAYPVASLGRAIDVGDDSALSRIPGVGKKTAQRLILELKGKLVTEAPMPAHVAPTEDPLVAALLRLGYVRAEIEQVRQGLSRENILPTAPLADRLRASLKLLYKAEA